MGISGIEGVELCSSSDCVHMFSTRNGAKLDMRTLEKLNGKNIFYHNVPEKKQNVDMHLISFLGFLIGSGKRDIAIISKDTDYDDAIGFWKKESDAGIKRGTSISAFTQKHSLKTEQKQNTGPKAVPPKALATKTMSEMTSNEKMALNSAVLQALQKAGFDQSTTGAVASMVAKYREHPQRKTYIHGELIKRFGSIHGLRIYNLVKALL